MNRIIFLFTCLLSSQVVFGMDPSRRETFLGADSFEPHTPVTSADVFFGENYGSRAPLAVQRELGETEDGGIDSSLDQSGADDPGQHTPITEADVFFGEDYGRKAPLPRRSVLPLRSQSLIRCLYGERRNRMTDDLPDDESEFTISEQEDLSDSSDEQNRGGVKKRARH